MLLRRLGQSRTALNLLTLPHASQQQFTNIGRACSQCSSIVSQLQLLTPDEARQQPRWPRRPEVWDVVRFGVDGLVRELRAGPKDLGLSDMDVGSVASLLTLGMLTPITDIH